MVNWEVIGRMGKKYTDIAADIIKNVLKVKKDEKILVITDKLTLEFGEAYRDAADSMGHHVTMLVIPVTQTDGDEPPLVVKTGMMSCDIVIAVSKFSLTHCKANKEARERGTRILSTPNINRSLFLSQANILSAEEKADTVRVSELFTIGNQISVTTKNGTDVSFRIGGWDRAAGIDNCVIEAPGTMGNLPAGESFIVPVIGTGNGVIVADASVSGGQGILTKPITVEIKDGIITSVKGSEQAEALEEIFNNSGQNGRIFAEFAIGLNRKAEIIGAMVMDEKLRGTAHIGVGNSQCMGGDLYANSHIDILFHDPTIEIDGEFLAKDGELFLGDKKFEDYRNYSGDALGSEIKLNTEIATVVDCSLCRKWQDAWGKTYYTRVGLPQTMETVLAYYNALSENRLEPGQFGGQEEINRLNRLLMRYGIVS